MGPVSGWVSGLLTAAAVSIALFQAIGARRDAELNRRFDQAKAILPIWSSVAQLDHEYVEFKESIIEVRPTTLRTTNSRQSAQARDELEKSYRIWRRAVRKTESAFELALVTITEPKTQQAVTNSYSLFSQFAHQCFIAKKTIELGRPEKFKETDKLLRRLRSSRREVVLIARVHLIREPRKSLEQSGRAVAVQTLVALPVVYKASSLSRSEE